MSDKRKRFTRASPAGKVITKPDVKKRAGLDDKKPAQGNQKKRGQTDVD